MGPAVRTVLSFVLLTADWGHMAVESDRDLRMCGVLSHCEGQLKLLSRVAPGCDNISISASNTTLSVRGTITARCSNQSSQLLSVPRGPTPFCVVWEPLLDTLSVQVNDERVVLCQSRGLQDTCCTHLSPWTQTPSSLHGIENATIQGDLLRSQAMSQYTFKGIAANCKREFCGKAEQESMGVDMIEDAVLNSGTVGRVELPCAQGTVIEMKEDFTGYNITLHVPGSVPPNRTPSVRLPAGLRPAQRKTAKVVCTYFTNSTLFQMSSKTILEDVVGISVENEVITNLPKPVTITFRHAAVGEGQTTKCVSWDTRKDPKLVWREEGCVTARRGAQDTECWCYHLTYFAILVQTSPGTLRHLEALTFITGVGCALSAVSCVVLFVSLCRRKSNQSSLVHRGLVVALFFLCVLFVLSGTVANVSNEWVCRFMGALLHYVLLSSLCWMAVEVLHTFWMVCVIFNPPKPRIWYLVGFGFPVLPVVIFASMGNIYGQRTITQSEGLANPYHMCWMLDSHAALVAHYITNVGLLAAVVISGFVILCLVVTKILKRSEWKERRVAFLSIWGLSCLFGTTWGLTFFSLGPLSEIVLFLFCIINSLQGFFLMLRFFFLAWVHKRSGDDPSSTSMESSEQRKLHGQDKSER